MNTFALLLLIGLFVLGLIYTYQVVSRLADEKKKRQCTSEDLIHTTSPIDLAFVLVFGPFVIFIRRGIRKIRR